MASTTENEPISKPVLEPESQLPDSRWSAWTDRFRGVSATQACSLASASERGPCVSVHSKAYKFIARTDFCKATVQDLDLPNALSITPSHSISFARNQAFERDFSFLPVVSQGDRSLIGYLNIERLDAQLADKVITGKDPVDKAVQRFEKSRSRPYKVITPDTPLEELDSFFAGKDEQGIVHESRRQDFAVVTDARRKFVVGVVTTADLQKFLARRGF